MPQQFTTGQVYTKFENFSNQVEAWLKEIGPEIYLCDSEQVKKRILQRIVELSADVYSNNILSSQHTTTASPDELMDFDQFHINQKTGEVNLKPLFRLLQTLYFIGGWLYIVGLISASLVKSALPRTLPITLLMEGGNDKDSDERFVEFCRKGPISTLNNSGMVIVGRHSPPAIQKDPRIIYAKRPMLFVALRLLSRKKRIKLLISYLYKPFSLLASLILYPVNALCARDLPLIPLLEFLDKSKLIEAIMITTSGFQSQPLWARGLQHQYCKLHMIWYSQNFIPKIYLGEEKGSNLPSARHMRPDVHWVWTEGFKTYLEELGQKADIHVVGPILWYLPQQNKYEKKTPVNIAVFDVTPVAENRSAFGAAKNYYSQSAMKKFILDIVEVCEQLESELGIQVSVLLKHKRVPVAGFHDQSYLEFLDKLVAEKERLAMIESNINLYDFLDHCDLSISVPYTSTAYVGAHLSKPGLYYDAYGELIPRIEKDANVDFIASREELLSTIRTIFNQ